MPLPDNTRARVVQDSAAAVATAILQVLPDDSPDIERAELRARVETYLRDEFHDNRQQTLNEIRTNQCD